MPALLSADPVGEALRLARFPSLGRPITCAVSGGPDSLALLVVATRAGHDVTAVHVDHGLRPDSGEDAGVVAAAATRFGAAFRSERVHVAPGGNLEARARRARYAVLPDDVLTGHTADDQAETVLLNLLRGAGTDGLAGIAPQRRPLLAVRRATTHSICEVMGLTPLRDPSNDDPVHLRNRVRHELVPLLGDLAGRDPVPILARQAEIVRNEAELLATYAAAVDPTDAKALRSAPPALARRAVRAWLRGCSAEHHPPDAAAVQRVLAVADHATRATEVHGGWRVLRSGDRLRLEPPEAR